MMAQNIIIRPVEKKDLPQMTVIERATFSMPWTEQGFASSLDSADTLYLLVEKDGEIAGYCGYLRSFEIADITNMAIAEGYRGQGIGELLLRRLMEEGSRLGVERFTLEVRRSNIPAIHLYEKLGFVTEGVRPRFYQHPTEDALIMWTK